MTNVPLADRRRGNRIFLAILAAILIVLILLLLVLLLWAPAPLEGIG